MVSFKSLSVLVLGVFAATAATAPLREGPVELAARANGGSQQPSGKIWWSQFQGTTACGEKYKGNDTDNQKLVAVSGKLWNHGRNCGKKLIVRFENAPHKEVEVNIVDTCSGCGLLLSKAAFEVSKPVAAGVTWGSWRLAPNQRRDVDEA